jgi:hypothetical protein
VPTPPAGPEKVRSGSSLCALEWAKTGSLRQLPLAGGYL